MENAKVYCDCCQKECIPTEYTPGYGIAGKDSTLRQAGDKLCFACCAVDDKAQMDRDGKIALYLTHDYNNPCPIKTPIMGVYANSYSHKGKVTNWPGTLSFPCFVKKGHHNIARHRYDVWFTDHNGNHWHGVQYGDNTQICRCRKISKKK